MKQVSRKIGVGQNEQQSYDGHEKRWRGREVIGTPGAWLIEAPTMKSLDDHNQVNCLQFQKCLNKQLAMQIHPPFPNQFSLFGILNSISIIRSFQDMIAERGEKDEHVTIHS